MQHRLAFCAWLLLSTSMTTAALAGDGEALQIVVSKNRQTLTVYDRDQVIASSHISTGKPGHDTPTGIFSVIEKQKFHRSNKYSNAPMPWMQRITWSGVALHESNSVPNRPASHGCVRMPAKFARSLYDMTARGANVIIADGEVMPQKLEGDVLFRPKASAADPTFMADAAMRPALQVAGKSAVEVAMNDPAVAKNAISRDLNRTPISILITRASDTVNLSQVQFDLKQLGYDAGIEDGAMKKQTRAAIEKFKQDNNLPAGNGNLDKAFVAALFDKAHRPLPQNGLLIIRRNFAEVYRAPVTIDNPETALGTHFMEARDVDPERGTVEWYGMSLDNHLPDAARQRLGITAEAPVETVPNAGVAALARIKMADDAKSRVAELLAEGSGLTITDVESRDETGEGTNFITITRRSPAGG